MCLIKSESNVKRTKNYDKQPGLKVGKVELPATNDELSSF